MRLRSDTFQDTLAVAYFENTLVAISQLLDSIFSAVCIAIKALLKLSFCCS